jgi:hypothetical protein
MTLAKDTVHGRFYRRTRNESEGAWWERHKRNPTEEAERLTFKGQTRDGGYTLPGDQVFLLAQCRRHPDWILMTQFYRSRDQFKDRNVDWKRNALVPPDTRFVEVASRPPRA